MPRAVINHALLMVQFLRIWHGKSFGHREDVVAGRGDRNPLSRAPPLLEVEGTKHGEHPLLEVEAGATVAGVPAVGALCA